MDSNQTSSSEKVANTVLTTFAGSLSIFGAIFIIVTFIAWKDLRTNPRKILVYISIGDLLTALVNISGMWGSEDIGVFCKAQATINIASILSSFFWTVHLSLYLYLALYIRMRSSTERRVMAVFHVTGWGIPLFVAILALSLNVVGQTRDITSDGWCWINTKIDDWRMLLFWMVFAGKGWEIISYVAISFFYIKVKLSLKKQVYPNPGTPFLTTPAVALRADRKYTFIPIIFILLRIWGTVRFFRYALCLPGCQSVGVQNPQPWLSILHGIGDSSQGFANFIIFCIFTQKIRSRLKYWFSRVCPCHVVSKPKPRLPYQVGYDSSTNILTDQSYEQ